MDLLILAAAAERAGVTPSALRVAIHDKRLAGVKAGRDWYVELRELDRYISERRTWKRLGTQKGGDIDNGMTR